MQTQLPNLDQRAPLENHFQSINEEDEGQDPGLNGPESNQQRNVDEELGFRTIVTNDEGALTHNRQNEERQPPEISNDLE